MKNPNHQVTPKSHNVNEVVHRRTVVIIRHHPLPFQVVNHPRPPLLVQVVVIRRVLLIAMENIHL